MDRFRIGLSGCGGGFETVSSNEILELAENAESLGFDALWLNTCAAKIDEMRRAWGMNYLNALSAFFGFLPLPQLRRSLQLLAEEVRPRLQRVQQEPIPVAAFPAHSGN